MDSVLIPCFLTNFLITKSRLSLSNTEILCEENFKILNFSWQLFASLMIGQNLLTLKNTPLKGVKLYFIL